MPPELVLLLSINGRTKREDFPTLSYISNLIFLMEESTSDEHIQPLVIEISNDKEDQLVLTRTPSLPSSLLSPPPPVNQSPQSTKAFLSEIVGFICTITVPATPVTLSTILEEPPTYQQT